MMKMRIVSYDLCMNLIPGCNQLVKVYILILANSNFDQSYKE